MAIDVLVRFFGLVMGGCLPSAQVGDFLTTIYDQNAGMNGGPVSMRFGVGFKILTRFSRHIRFTLRLSIEHFLCYSSFCTCPQVCSKEER